MSVGMKKVWKCDGLLDAPGQPDCTSREDMPPNGSASPEDWIVIMLTAEDVRVLCPSCAVNSGLYARLAGVEKVAKDA